MFKKQKLKQHLLPLSLGSLLLCLGAQPAMATLSGTYTINPAAAASATNYLTITSALSDLNSGTRSDLFAANGAGVSGPVVFQLANVTYSTGETYPLTINAVTGASATNTITIRPASGATPTISGGAAFSSTILLNGADYVTIDGSNNGTTGKNLTITNPSTGNITAVIRLASAGAAAGATYNTIKNCNITAVPTTASVYGILIAAGTSGTIVAGPDNDNNTIQNNTITNAHKSIYVVGAAANLNDNLLITQNTIVASTNNRSEGIALQQCTGAVISFNTFDMATSTIAPTAIALETGVVSTICTRNLVTNLTSTATAGYSGRGILVCTGNTSSNITISNNVLYGITGTGWNSFSSGACMGIGIGYSPNVGVANTGGINIYNNSVYLSGNYNGLTTANIKSACLWLNSNASALNVRNNVFVNTLNNTGTGTGAKEYAIFSAAANTAFTNIDYNDYYVSGTNNILGFLTSDRTTLTAIQSGFGGNTNSLNADPLFTSTTNLKPAYTSPLAAAGTNVGVTIDYEGYTRGAIPSIGAYEVGILWNGNSSTAWGTGGNWDGGSVPTTSQVAIIPSGRTRYPLISSGTVSAGTINVLSGGSITVSGGTLQVAGGIGNSGTFDATGGTLELNGAAAQTIQAGTLTTTNLVMNNSSTGATISNGMINVLGTYTRTSGVLAANGFLTLKSTATATARVATSASTGYITGNVIVERYIPGGRRAFRFFAHPFNAAMAISEFTDDIDITGTGGSPFTTTGSNNPSAFIYDVSAGTGSASNDPGWSALTASSTIARYQGARILVRGIKGQGLTGAPTPTEVTMDMTGELNTGTQTIPVTKGSGTPYAVVGNPFASPINMDAVSSTSGFGTDIGANFYVWNAQQGLARGGYTTYSYGTSGINIPASGSFVTQVIASGNLIVEEGDKAATGTTMFKTTDFANTVTLHIEDSTIFWDRMQLHFDDKSMAVAENIDAPKFFNPELSFYTFSKDDSALAIDNRPYADKETIAIGFNTPYQKNYKIVAVNFDMVPGTKLFLKDYYTNTTQEVTESFEYWFTVNADSASQGNKRFELNTQGTPTTGITAKTNDTKLKVKLVPNPATELVTLYYEGATGSAVSITLTNMVGTKVAEATGTAINGSISMPLQHIAAGIYIATIRNGNEILTQKLIKQ